VPSRRPRLGVIVLGRPAASTACDRNQPMPESVLFGVVKQGKMCGNWRILGKIGGGGNGEVYRCQNLDGMQAAIKILRRSRDRRGDRIPRFRNEIRFLRERRNYPGVLPMLDYALPDNPVEPSWYVMPIATPLVNALGEAPPLPTVVDAIGQIALTLARLAADGVEGHRDIKPDNLFQLNDQRVIGDFGLVKYPGQETGTKQGRPLGPADFMAPEMRHDADTAKAQPADVYSLAKTLWCVATGQRYPPPGQLRSDRPELCLSAHVDDPRAVQLDPYIERCTSHEPAARPTMQELEDELMAWSAPSSVPVQADLSAYVEEVGRLRESNQVRVETERERLSRLYHDAQARVHSRLTLPLMAAVEKSGLRNMGSVPRTFEPGALDGYGSSVSVPCWGIDTLASPILVAAIGIHHKLPSFEETTDLAITATIAVLTESSQHSYLQEMEQCRSGSVTLDQAIDKLESEINTKLPTIIAKFLTTCREIGVPRKERSDRP
jgi:serine/threonine protein kinase